MTDLMRSARTRNRFALFAYGFRPFFMLSGLYAIIAMALWLWMYRTGTSPLTAIPAQLWHGHEMLFGFVGATIAGFMLTAVPSWTGRKGFAGAPLILLTLLWMSGRAAFIAADQIPAVLLVTVELAFVPALMLMIAPSVLGTPNRNAPLLLVLTAYWTLDAVFLWAALHDDVALARRMLLGALDLVLLLITIVGGRIVPAFTSNALKRRGIGAPLRNWRSVERVAITSMILLVAAGLFRAQHEITGWLAALAAAAHLARLGGWRTHRTLADPLVWVLHAAYAWLPVGLGLRALHLLGGFSFAAHWLHALSAGAAATMILAVMTRAALGHTGRPLRAPTCAVWAYTLLILAGSVRVFGPAVWPPLYEATVMLAAALWISAFALFVVAYAPVLMRARVDGRPG